LPRVDLGYKPGEGLAGWIIKNRSAVVIDDTLNDKRWSARPDQPDLRSVMAIPLISSDEVIGVLTLFHQEPGAFSSEQLELVEAAANQVANAISNAQLYLLIRDQAERLGRMLREEHIEAAKNQAILESIADGVLVADHVGRVILANLSASQILQVSRSELIGKSVNELLGLYSSSGQNWIDTILAWAHSGEIQDQRPSLSELLSIDDRTVSIKLSPVFASGQFFGTVSIFRDVTREVEVDRMKSEFVSTVSHELRTPMTSIKGYAELMLMGAAGHLSDPQTQYLRIIRNNANRMTDLVNDLLDISRMESGKTDLDLGPVDISQLIEQVVKVHLTSQMDHENKSLQVYQEIAPSLPLVWADRDRVTQILTNLLDNAFHYTPANGRIQVSAFSDDSFVFVSVEDTGIGISPENQEKIFERFFRAEDVEVQNVPGTGLGLAIVRNLLEMQGGTIEVTSYPTQGSKFVFSLPLASEELSST
jgi:PAS domain S-box-containing protein